MATVARSAEWGCVKGPSLWAELASLSERANGIGSKLVGSHVFNLCHQMSFGLVNEKKEI